VPRKRFSPYNKPLAPVKPQEYISSSEPLFSISLEPYSSLALTDEIREILASADSIHIADVDVGYDDTIDSIQLSFRSSVDHPNPNYEQQLEIYLEKYSAYKEKLAWWKAEKAKYDAKEAKKKEAAERRQLERLQKKYGTEP